MSDKPPDPPEPPNEINFHRLIAVLIRISERREREKQAKEKPAA